VCCIVKRRRRTLVEERVKKKKSGVSQMRSHSHYGMSLFPIQRSREPKLSSGCSLVPGIGGVPKPRIKMLWVCEHLQHEL
jgi:hypothetical protein